MQKVESIFNVSPLAKDPTQQKAALMMLRMLKKGSGLYYFKTHSLLNNKDLLRFIDLEELYESDASNKEVFAAINKRHAELEAQSIPLGLLESQLAKIAKTLCLTKVEVELLCFLTLREYHPEINDALELFEITPTFDINRFRLLISFALQVPLQEIINVLSFDSVLVYSRIIEIDASTDKVELACGIHYLLLDESQGTQTLLELLTQPSQPATLVAADFKHVEDRYKSLKKYINTAIRTADSGVNILLYGASGTGKKELVRILVNELNLEMYEVKLTNELGNLLGSKERLPAYVISQQALKSNPRSVLFFDDVEHTFGTEYRFGRDAWLNKILENNPRPTFWVSDNIDFMGEAFLHRCDMIIRMPDVDEELRLRRVKRTLQGLEVRDGWLQALVKNKRLQPEYLKQAVKVVKKMRLRKQERIEEKIEQLLSDIHQARGKKWFSQSTQTPDNPPLIAPDFKPEFVNTDFSLNKLIAGLQRSDEARLCLYGPPGTGKTAFGRYISQELNKPLVMKKASDLRKSLVGETEEKIAEAFYEAKKKSAILMIDEADSFLAARSHAQRIWEVSQVNEMLVQMENYNGILIMSTNFMDGLDSAALRRFDIKINFDYLKTETALALFNNLLSEHDNASAEPISQAMTQRLSRLDQITPGDFATVRRRARIMGDALTADTLLVGLEQEHAVKTRGRSRAIGFIH